MYKAGQQVKINAEGHEKYGSSADLNPRDTIGTVLGLDPNDDDEWFEVKWPSGLVNTYESGTLDVISDE